MTSPHHTADPFTVTDIDTTRLATDLDLTAVFAPDGPLAGCATTRTTWHLATCHRCGVDMAQPFLSPDLRDGWAIDHAGGTGHAVVVSTEPLHPHTTAVLRTTAEGWTWICVGCSARRTDDTPAPTYDTGQQALAAFRASHTENDTLDTPRAL